MMQEMFKGKFTVEKGGIRVDSFVRNLHPGLSRKIVQKAIEKGLVLVNGKRTFKGYVLFKGDVVEVKGIPTADAMRPVKDESLSLKVIEETEHFVVVEKPAGMPTAPLVWDEKGTVANYVAAKYPEVFDVGKKGLDGGMLNRLDVDVSGFILCARTQEFYDEYLKWQDEGKVKKIFIAMVEGKFPPQMWITAPILFLKGRERKVYTSIPSGFRAKVRKEYPAETFVKALKYTGRTTLVRVEVVKAARHQIRAHLAHAGYPVVGDKIYGKKKSDELMKLHLFEVQMPEFENPSKTRIIRAPMPGWASVEGVKEP